MTALWLLAPGFLLAGAPAVGIALARVHREAQATHDSVAALSTDIRAQAGGLRAASLNLGAAARSIEAPRFR